MIRFLQSRLSPFKYKTFRQYFVVQTISMIGTWSHDLARAWIVVDLMGNSSSLGLLMLSLSLPPLFFILKGGILVDFIDSQKIMIVTRSLLAISALLLAVLTEFGHIKLWHLLIFGIIEGAILAFDSPAEQTIRTRLVPKNEFQQSISLSSSNFHLARMMGPLVAGILLAFHGPSLVFLFDGISYLALLLILYKIKLEPRTLNQKDSPSNLSFIESTKETFHYLQSTPKMKFRFIQLLITICTVFPIMMVLFRSLLAEKFQMDGSQFGFMFSLPALGALTGAATFALWKPKNPIHALITSIPGGVVTISLIPLIPSLETTGLLLAINGFFTYITFAALTISIHLDVKEELRGRIGSLIGLCFISLGPLAGFPVGFIGDFIGQSITNWILIGLYGVLSLILAIRHNFNTRNL